LEKIIHNSNFPSLKLGTRLKNRGWGGGRFLSSLPYFPI